MARVNVDILGISELEWTGMGECNSDDHYIYYCGQESLRRNGVAIMINKRVWNAVLGCNLKNDRISLSLISHTSKVILKILQARLQQYVNWELPDVQAGFRKGRRNQRSNCQHLLDHQKSKRVPEKHLLLYWLHQSLWLCGSQQTVENS